MKQKHKTPTPGTTFNNNPPLPPHRSPWSESNHSPVSLCPRLLLPSSSLRLFCSFTLRHNVARPERQTQVKLCIGVCSRCMVRGWSCLHVSQERPTVPDSRWFLIQTFFMERLGLRDNSSSNPCRRRCRHPERMMTIPTS